MLKLWPKSTSPAGRRSWKCILFRQAWSALLASSLAGAQVANVEDLARLTPGRTKAENALWIENQLSARFNSSKQVVVADLKGPGVITMIHFAMPQTLKLNRDGLLRLFWDGEPSPSVDCPLVDFFCDPAGLREQVNSALVNTSSTITQMLWFQLLNGWRNESLLAFSSRSVSRPRWFCLKHIAAKRAASPFFYCALSAVV